jgi:hypothetical protein
MHVQITVWRKAVRVWTVLSAAADSAARGSADFTFRCVGGAGFLYGQITAAELPLDGGARGGDGVAVRVGAFD